MIHCAASTYWVESSFASFGVSVLLTGIIIPQILLIAFRKKLFDKQDSRKIHQGIVPRLGGIAFLPSIFISLAAVIGCNLRFGGDTMPEALSSCIVPLCFLICASLMLYLVGIADDLVGVRYRAKFIVQILSAAFLITSGLYVKDLYGLFWLNMVDPWFGWLSTIFLVVYVVNSVNLIDGIDGLAAGLCALALAFYSIVLFSQGYYIYCLIGCASIGTLIPFIYYNVFGSAKKRNKIFMGDTGSLTSGMILVFLCIIVLQEPPTADILENFNPVILAISPLVVPCFDTVRVTLHRIMHHRNPFLPDRSHIHHKLLAVGMSSGKALSMILLLSLFFMAFNFWLSMMTDPTLILLCDIIIWTIFNIFLTSLIHKREKQLGRKLYD